MGAKIGENISAGFQVHIEQAIPEYVSSEQSVQYEG